MENSAVQYVDSLLLRYKEKLASKGVDLKNQCDELIHKLEEVRNIQKLLEENQKKHCFLIFYLLYLKCND